MRTIPLVGSAELDVPIELAYAYVTDPRNDPSWWRAVEEVRQVPDEPDAFEMVTVVLGVRHTIHFTVVRSDPPAQAVLRSTRSNLPFVATYRFEALSERKTRFTMLVDLSVSGAYRLFGPLFGPLMRRAMRQQMRNLPVAIEQAGATSAAKGSGLRASG